MAAGQTLARWRKARRDRAIALVGTEVLALGVFGKDAWRKSISGAGRGRDSHSGSSRAIWFLFPLCRPRRKIWPHASEKIDEGSQNFFGLDPEHDVESRDDIVSASLVIPMNKEISLMMHAKDVGHSFYVRELRIQQTLFPVSIFPCISPPLKPVSTKSFVRSFVGWAITTCALFSK